MSTVVFITLVARARRVALSLLGAGVVLLVAAGVAAADDNADGRELGGAMSWIKLEDSHGLSIWQYNLNVHRGSAMDPWKFVWSIIIEIPWQIFRLIVALSSWLLRFTLEFSWLKVVTAPFTALADSLSGIVTSIGIGGTLITVAAFVCVLWMARGMWALGVSELVISLVVAAVATSALADPMDRVIGTDGAIYQARDLGLEVAVELAADDPEATTNPVPQQMSALLVDTFVRQPHQLINYGRSFEGGSCEEIYNEAVRMEPLPPDDRAPREHVRSCDEDAYSHADNPGPGHGMVIAALYPAGLLIVLLVVAIAISLFLAVMLALAQGLKAVVSLVAGVLPGRGRGMLLRNIADLIIALTLVAFTSIFASGFMTMIKAVFSSTGTYSWNLMMTLYLVDLLLMVGIIAIWRYHKAFRRAGERLAEAMASARPGKATALPGRSTAIHEAAKIGATVWGWRQVRQMSRRTSPHSPAPTPPGEQPSAPLPRPGGSVPAGQPTQRTPAGVLTGGDGARRALPAAGPGPRPELGPGTGTPGGIPMPTAGAAARKLAGAAGRAVAGGMTGGVSNVAIAGARVAGKTAGAARRALSGGGQARRARLLQRLVSDAGGTVPAPTQLPLRSRPVRIAPLGGSSLSPAAKPIPDPRPPAKPTVQQVARQHLQRRRARRVVLPNGQVVIVPDQASQDRS